MGGEFINYVVTCDICLECVNEQFDESLVMILRFPATLAQDVTQLVERPFVSHSDPEILYSNANIFY